MYTETTVIKRRVDIFGRYILIVPNIASGCKGRYTVYLLPTSDGGKVKIVGRELPLGHAKRIARAHSKRLEENARKYKKRCQEKCSILLDLAIVERMLTSSRTPVL
jgi:hypothetical protein